ncbi:unnamed protein product [Colias eurytheme]|nr:unnamed protein product [Colias eurytheme]
MTDKNSADVPSCDECVHVCELYRERRRCVRSGPLTQLRSAATQFEHDSLPLHWHRITNAKHMSQAIPTDSHVC